MNNYIFTFNYMINYGAFLQCYALFSLNKKNIVADLMPCNIFEYKNSVGPYGRKKYPIIWRLLAFKRFARSFFYSRKYFFPENKKIIFSRRFFKWNGKQAKTLLDGMVAIVGSDQVWNPKFIQGREDVFFAQNANYSKRIAYAVSLGMSKWPDIFERKVYDYLKNFNAISVREKSAADYLSSIGIQNVAWVCDPTIFFDGSFYRKNFPNNLNISSFVFSYTIREKVPTSYLEFGVKKSISIAVGKNRNIVSVTEWLAYIDKSDYVVTDSFHCVVFCLLFHKKFIVLLNNSRGEGMNERFSSLLGRVNLSDRCVFPGESEENVERILSKTIDWKKIDSILDVWRNESIDWLNRALDE